MMTLRMKLVHICLLFCLLFSMVSFVFAGALNEGTTRVWETRIGAWVMEDDNSSNIWEQAIAGGCQAPTSGGSTC